MIPVGAIAPLSGRVSIIRPSRSQSPGVPLGRDLPFFVLSGGLLGQDSDWSLHQRAVHAALGISARQVDDALPDTPLLQWLQDVVGPATPVIPVIPAMAVIDCDPPMSLEPPREPDGLWTVCARVRAVLPDNRSLEIALIGELQATSTEPRAWVPRRARLSKAYVRDNDRNPRHSLKVLTLSDLRRQLTLQPSQWPKADLMIASSDLRVEPASFDAGDQILVSVTVQNIGTDDARVSGFLARLPECNDVGQMLASFQGFIPAGQAETWKAQIVVGQWGSWYLSASTEVIRESQYILKSDVTQSNNHAYRFMGKGSPRNCGVP